MAKKKNEVQKLVNEVSDSLSSLGEELVYWITAFIQSMIKEFLSMAEEFQQFLHSLLGMFAGGFIPPAETLVEEITEEDLLCKR